MLAFSTRPSAGIAQKGTPAKGKGVDKVSLTVGENDAERPAIEDVNTVQAEGNHDVEEKMTESEWVARWNSEAVDCVLTCEEILLAVTMPDSMRIILDSGATSTVVGRSWMQEYVKNKLKPPILKSSKSFRFDDSSRHCSMGSVKLEFEVDSMSGDKGNVRLICMVEADIVNCDVPLLISRTALTRVAGILNFGDNSLLVNGKYRIGLKQYGDGHLGFQVATHERTEQQKRETLAMYSAEEMSPVVSEEEGAEECVASEQIRKRYVLAHLDLINVMKMLRMAKEMFEGEMVRAEVGKCLCKSSRPAEVVSLGTALDLALGAKVVVVEFFTGRLIREILDTTDNYAVQTPFDPAPSTIAAKQEISDMSQCADNLCDGEDPPAIQEQLADAMARGFQEAEKKFAGAFNDSHVEMLKTFVFTDVSNAYSSIISGSPSTTERFLRINLSYICDLAPLIA